MTNEFGVKLDSSGYAPSIVQTTEGCFLCRRTDRKLDRHEIFHGINHRSKSKRLGLWVNLCHEECHIFGDEAAHRCYETDHYLKYIAELAALARYDWCEGDFIKEFGKNYI